MLLSWVVDKIIRTLHIDNLKHINRILEDKVKVLLIKEIAFYKPKLNLFQKRFNQEIIIMI
jgi:hypothetical protein